jgi:Uma2 family endonuclease
MKGQEMSQAAAQHVLHTIEEFEAYADQPEHGDRRFELIHGEIVEKVPTEEHGVIAAWLAALILNFVRPRRLGRVSVEPRHRVPGDEHNARLPDIAYTSAERALPLVKTGSVPQMPDLAIEIQSPTDKPRELREKAAYYLHNGAQLVWLMYPGARIVEVCRLDADGVMQIETLDDQGTLDGGEVLPGFTVSVHDIFDVE